MESKNNKLSPIQAHNETIKFIGIKINIKKDENIIVKIYKEMNNVLKNSEPKRNYIYTE